MTRSLWKWGRLGGSALVVGVLIWRLGTSPFLDGLRRLDGGALAGGAGLTALATVLAAWRWRVVAGALGVEVSLPAAIAA